MQSLAGHGEIFALQSKWDSKFVQGLEQGTIMCDIAGAPYGFQVKSRQQEQEKKQEEQMRGHCANRGRQYGDCDLGVSSGNSAETEIFKLESTANKMC